MVCEYISWSGIEIVTPRAFPLGKIFTLYSLFAPLVNSVAMTWPISCRAVFIFSSSVTTRDLRSTPTRVRSIARSKSLMSKASRPAFTELRTAKLTMLEMSAPVLPKVMFAMCLTSTSGECFTLLRYRLKISILPLISGRGMFTSLSKRPERFNALSRLPGRLVAPITMILSVVLNPSISTSSWFKDCLLKFMSLLALLPPRASISSMNTMQGALRLASSKSSLMRLAPSPTKTSSKSEPEAKKNLTPASPAIALASKVLPVPGSPVKSTPLGSLAPLCWNFLGSLRKATISWSSALHSSMPLTSSNLTLEVSATFIFFSDMPGRILLVLYIE
mmetsp:Transcript_16544/g.29804  ORF Transcript_16544/g.29804 Transcript_16544/m.29804 type:complete len:333 (-) Transcript_16544:331-1329(-)